MGVVTTVSVMLQNHISDLASGSVHVYTSLIKNGLPLALGCSQRLGPLLTGAAARAADLTS